MASRHQHHSLNEMMWHFCEYKKMESQLLLVILPFGVFVFSYVLKQCFCIFNRGNASPLLLLPVYCVQKLENGIETCSGIYEYYSPSRVVVVFRTDNCCIYRSFTASTRVLQTAASRFDHFLLFTRRPICL